MPSSSPNLSDPNHQFDKSKQYTQVVFQQGKPILDVDLNDMGQALHAQSTALIAEKMGYGPSQIDFREWAMVAVNGTDLDSDRNKDNFAVTLGRVDTLKGVVDTSTFKSGDALAPHIIFDYQKIVTNGAASQNDREFANYLLKGTVTSSTANSFTDANKNFVTGNNGHHLTGFSFREDISPAYATINLTADNQQTLTENTFSFRFEESACRVVFATSGEVYTLSSVTNTTTLTATQNFTTQPQVGESYYIIPANTLQEYRELYNATTTQSASTSEGVAGLPKLLTYIQVFEEDISSEEDTNIQSSALGFESTHRTALRWCVRVAKIKHSKSGDQSSGVNLDALRSTHIFQFFNTNEFIENHVLTDSTDTTSSSHNSAQQSTFWRKVDSTGAVIKDHLANQNSPYSSLGLSPMHFFNAEEAKVDSLYWSLLKAILIKNSGGTFNDYVVLSVMSSENKTAANAGNETLSEYFFPDAVTDINTTPIVHAWLSTGTAFKPSSGDTNLTSGEFKSPPRVFHTQIDLGLDNMKSRTLHGLRGGLMDTNNAHLVFDSVSSHMSFLDQVVLGMSGLGSMATNADNVSIPAATNFTLTGTTTGLSQSGYGIGAIKPFNPISNTSFYSVDGFTTGNKSYLLREKGSRSSHTVSSTDADLGWSLYKYEGSDLVNNGRTDFTLRGWDEGPAQAVSFQQGLNFRKLALKTIAHKSMDLFTISEPPLLVANQLALGSTHRAAATAFQIPVDQSKDSNGNLFIDSYSAGANNETTTNANFSSHSFIPASVTRFSDRRKSLLEVYEPDGGIKSFSATSGSNVRETDMGIFYGPWNRFNTASMRAFMPTGMGIDGDTGIPKFSTDLWSNRCTAMRLRYHVGDFYPSLNVDSRGFRSNMLVDSMNLFVKVEPLSLAHWMTMPKHQHSILENSISFAQGIEALLKVAHGLGDTQKLVNNNNQPLVQDNSPARDELPERNRAVGEIDPLNLPFDHQYHPFIHWYHPAMHKIKGPKPSNTSSVYVGSNSSPYRITVYPKWGRRSLIVPALVPSKFGTHQQDIGGVTYKYPITAEGTDTFPELVGDTTNLTQFTTDQLDISDETSGTSVNESVLPYPYHGSRFVSTVTGNESFTTDDGQTIEGKRNSITFPAVGTSGLEITPTPVYIPASRMYAHQLNQTNEVDVGFHPLIRNLQDSYWNDIEDGEFDTFPYEEKVNYYQKELENADPSGTLPAAFQTQMDTWSVPVMRARISTTTVAGIVDLIRTSFATALDSATLNDDYNFTMPAAVLEDYHDTSRNYLPQNVPAVGPDNPLDTLFVGDLGTALGGFKDRSGFMSPLNLGVPMRAGVGLMPNGRLDSDDLLKPDVRDSFELATARLGSSSELLDSFNAINNMGLQQKLMWNCSFRVLHSRPSGRGSSTSSAPKSLTEVFLAHDRTTTTAGMGVKTFPAPANAARKPFIHLMSMHPATNNNFPNKSYMSHLYPMVCDSIGGPTDATLDATTGNYDYTTNQVKTASMGDTFAADPFDYMMNDAVLGTNNPLREADLQHKNSGIEIDLLHELDTIHSNIGAYGLDDTANINGELLSLQNTIPTANELTQPGDHELVFVLYTGHYGAKMHDINDDVSVEYIPPVAGCHLTATLEINRPSDRDDSTAEAERHYGLEVDSNPIKTYSILSTK